MEEKRYTKLLVELCANNLHSICNMKNVITYYKHNTSQQCNVDALLFIEADKIWTYRTIPTVCECHITWHFVNDVSAFPVVAVFTLTTQTLWLPFCRLTSEQLAVCHTSVRWRHEYLSVQSETRVDVTSFDNSKSIFPIVFCVCINYFGKYSH